MSSFFVVVLLLYEYKEECFQLMNFLILFFAVKKKRVTLENGCLLKVRRVLSL